MKKERYSDFHYRIVKPTEPGYVRVEVTFKFKGLSTKHYMFFDEKKGVDYIAEAKKQVAEEIRKGRFDKIAHQHHINPAKVFGISMLGLAVVAAIFAPLAAKASKAAKTNKVEFDIHTSYYPIGALVPKTQTVLQNRRATEPTKDEFTQTFTFTEEILYIPVTWRYDFLYWTKDTSGQGEPEKFDFSTRITEDIKLYAYWDYYII